MFSRGSPQHLTASNVLPFEAPSLHIRGSGHSLNSAEENALVQLWGEGAAAEQRAISSSTSLLARPTQVMRVLGPHLSADGTVGAEVELRVRAAHAGWHRLGKVWHKKKEEAKSIQRKEKEYFIKTKPKQDFKNC